MYTLEILPVGTSVWLVKQMNVILQHPSLPSSDCPTLFVFSLRALGKDFSLNASFTARCSGSTKSICILNRKQRVKHAKEKGRQSMGPPTFRSLDVYALPGSLPAALIASKEGGHVSHHLSPLIWIPSTVGFWIWEQSGR